MIDVDWIVVWISTANITLYKRNVIFGYELKVILIESFQLQLTVRKPFLHIIVNK